MKTLLLVAGSRAGSEFFQSLFDGHPEVLQFPGNSITSKKQIEFVEELKNANFLILNGKTDSWGVPFNIKYLKFLCLWISY